MNRPRFRVRPNDPPFQDAGWRIDEVVTSGGHYITWPWLYSTKEKAFEAIEKMQKAEKREM